QTRRQFEIADAIHSSRRDFRRIVFEAKQELRAHQHEDQRVLDTIVEVTGLLSAVFEERDQPRRLGFGKRTAVGSAANRSNDFLRAWQRIRWCFRTASKYAAAAWRIVAGFRVERAFDRDPIQFRNTGRRNRIDSLPPN